MKKHTYISKQTQIQQRSYGWALLFLRLFIGGVVLLHIVGILQNYDNELLTCRRLLGLSAATSLAVAIIVEGLLSSMIVLGVGTRLAATIMLIIALLSLVELAIAGDLGSDMAKLEFLYVGIYITLIISGGGSFAFNVPYVREENNP